MDKKTVLKVVLIMIAGLGCALLIRGILLHCKNREAGNENIVPVPYEEQEVNDKLPYSGKIIVIDPGHGKTAGRPKEFERKCSVLSSVSYRGSII